MRWRRFYRNGASFSVAVSPSAPGPCVYFALAFLPPIPLRRNAQANRTAPETEDAIVPTLSSGQGSGGKTLPFEETVASTDNTTATGTSSQIPILVQLDTPTATHPSIIKKNQGFIDQASPVIAVWGTGDKKIAHPAPRANEQLTRLIPRLFSGEYLITRLDYSSHSSPLSPRSTTTPSSSSSSSSLSSMYRIRLSPK